MATNGYYFRIAHRSGTVQLHRYGSPIITAYNDKVKGSDSLLDLDYSQFEPTDQFWEEVVRAHITMLRIQEVNNVAKEFDVTPFINYNTEIYPRKLPKYEKQIIQIIFFRLGDAIVNDEGISDRLEDLLNTGYNNYDIDKPHTLNPDSITKSHFH